MRLLPLVYAELRRVAGRQLRSERADPTLQPTALVLETYIRLVDQRHVDWQNRAHFFGVAVHVNRFCRNLRWRFLNREPSQRR